MPDSERHRWLRAVWLHDALRDAPEEELTRWAPSTPGPPELRHGPASAARAKSEGETDRGVLDAVRYHSLGLAEWDMVGRILYCADYLEPGREHEREWRAELAERLPVPARARPPPGGRGRGSATWSAPAAPSSNRRSASGTVSSPRPPRRPDRGRGGGSGGRGPAAGAASAARAPRARLSHPLARAPGHRGGAERDLAGRRGPRGDPDAAASRARRGLLRQRGRGGRTPPGSSCAGAIRRGAATCGRRSARGGSWSSPTRSGGWT